jgi:phage tail sheath gpL-like
MSLEVVSKPEVTFNIIPGQNTISNAPQQVLFVGQMTASGSATSGELIQSIGNDNSENTLFGENSMLSAMIRAYKKLNQVTRIDAIPLDDNAGAVDSTGTVVIGGTSASEDGTLEVTVGSDKNHKYSINVITGDTPTVIGDAIEAAINADTKAPVTSANVTGTVTLTAVNGGTVANSITVRITGTVAGITTAVTAMTGGATDPVLTGVFDVVGDERYQTIVAPSEYGTTFLTDFLDPRFNATNNVLDGVAIITDTDTFANLVSTGNAENSQSLVIFGNQAKSTSTWEGSVLVELDHVISAQFASNRAKRLTQDAGISDIVIAPGGPLDSFGGPELASLPYFNTIFPDLPVLAVGDGFDATEEDSLNAAGISLFGNNIPKNAIITGEVVTTRKTDSAGNQELTFRFLNSVDTSSVIREFYFNNNKARFAQVRLTNGDLEPGRAMANSSSIRAFQVSLYQDLAGVLTESGETALNFYKDNLTVTTDLLLGKVTLVMSVQIVSQLRSIIGPITIEFSSNS